MNNLKQPTPSLPKPAPFNNSVIKGGIQVSTPGNPHEPAVTQAPWGTTVPNSESTPAPVPSDSAPAGE